MVNIMVIPGLDTQILYVSPNFDHRGASCIFLADPLWATGSHGSPNGNISYSKQ